MTSGLQTCFIRSVPDLQRVLGEIRRPLDEDELRQLAERIRLDRSAWEPHVQYRSDRFCYRTIYASAWFEVNVIGWRGGQQSSVHDHHGTACCVLVLDGVMTNIDYTSGGDGDLCETGRIQLQPGEILCRSDQAIHCCGNVDPAGDDLATLHLYSPPLLPLEQRRHDRG
ncbi:Cysteine dioxygenase [Maioricimonas rarisocia]|uniref:Cysteine dioxygenase n=1 Tax=Maioricimonas rarisocia TaxID=2528026 RepID=A0A517Z0I4_9PLAN|nr:cysteine dioxygenase family protein [Maioricimonas rarisocia]QDU35994.1 Cysteine dioxygenase [Maioricimonas rarisocia]